MKSIAINNYSLDSANWTVLSDEKPTDCVETATRIRDISKKTFGFFDWIYFYAIDLLSHLFQAFKERQFSIVKDHSRQIVEFQNNYLRLQKKVDRYVKDHFQVIGTNVEHINHADVICFGEVHGNLGHMYRNAQLIDALSEPEEDLVLLEHDEKLEFRSDQAKFVRKSIPIKGWDQLDKGAIQALASALKLDPIDVIGVLFFGELSFDREEKILWANQKILDDLPQRNAHMCKAIESNAKPGRRIYVIAGKGHLQAPEKLKDGNLDFTPQQMAFQQTLSYLKTKKFAILIPKTENFKINVQALAG